MNRYLVTVMRTPQFDTDLIDAHRIFLASLREQGHLELAGPFGDNTGGAYLLRADSLQAAEALAFSGPLHTSGSSAVSVREWIAA